MKYKIVPDYITKGTKRRSGRLINKVRFLVAHDTGNFNSTARNNVDYYKRTCNEQSASAHIFVDDKQIIECVPALTAPPEKAWHVLYNLPKDNELYGRDANDVAIGVELCYGSKINPNEAYKRYVWVLAYLCYKFNLNPVKDIVGHMTLDPRNRTDPVNALSKQGKTFEQLINDVATEFNSLRGGVKVAEPWKVDIAKNAKKAGLITSDHNPVDISEKWFVLQIALNVLNIVGKAIGKDLTKGGIL